MKRVFALCLTISLLFTLCGCADGGLFENEEETLLEILTPHYETEALIRTAGTELTARISHRSPERCEVELLSPETVAGLCYLFRQDNVDVLYKDLQFTFDAAAMPHTAPVSVTVSALSVLLRTDDAAALRAVDGGWELTGAVGATPCVLMVNEEGIPLSLTIPDLGLDIELRGFTYIRNEPADI